MDAIFNLRFSLFFDIIIGHIRLHEQALRARFGPCETYLKRKEVEVIKELFSHRLEGK